jgi:hypothetical protein
MVYSGLLVEFAANINDPLNNNNNNSQYTIGSSTLTNSIDHLQSSTSPRDADVSVRSVLSFDRQQQQEEGQYHSYNSNSSNDSNCIRMKDKHTISAPSKKEGSLCVVLPGDTISPASRCSLERKTAASPISPPGAVILSTEQPQQSILPTNTSNYNDTPDYDTPLSEDAPALEPQLSIRDLYKEEDWSEQDGFFEDDDYTPTTTSLEPSSSPSTPRSLIASPPAALSSLDLAPPEPLELPPTAIPSATTTDTNHNKSNGSGTHRSSNNPTSGHTTGGGKRNPVLYSAIGSLEDASQNSYKAWKHQRNKAAASKFEFPSTQLLPPQNTLVKYQNNKNHLGLHTTKSQTTTTTNYNKRSSNLATTLQTSPITAEVKAQPADATSCLTTITNSSSTNDIKATASKETVTSETSTPPQSNVTATSDKPSNLRKKTDKGSGGSKERKRVTLSKDVTSKRTPKEMFRPSSDAYTPRMGKKVIKYMPAEMRTPVQQMASPMGSLSRPNFKDALRRVAMILHQHIVKIEQRFESATVQHDDRLFMRSMMDEFSESNFATPLYRCTMVRVPMARPGMVYGLKKIKQPNEIPSEGEIYEFGHQLFNKVQLSSECSIVCLIYVERLMEIAKVPLLANTWRPIFMCGLLLASKVWQDLSSWNIEFTSVFPQFSLDAINRLELKFLRMVKWDLYISSSLYAKYYFALRSLVEKPDFRQRYNRMVGGVHSVEALEALKIEKRSTMVKEEALQQLSRSM